MVILGFILLLMASCHSSTESKSESKAELKKEEVATPVMDLHTAAVIGDLDVVRQHIEAGTDLDLGEPTVGSSPLITASVFGKTEVARALVEAGLHPGTGGDGMHACSGDMLLQALAACAGVTMMSVATSLGLRVAGSVHADGDLDFRGTLGIDREAPVGFTDIRLRFELDTDADADQLATLLRLTERYCVVLQTLAASPRLSASVVEATA